ncbi:hypothetical protein ACFX15_041506 [Malus domestica]
MEKEANGSSPSTELGMESTASGPAIWEQIELSESYLVCSMYEEAASLASSILKPLSQHSQHLEADGDRFELYDMSESAGMVLVQSLKQLGRTSEILNELKSLFASVATIPVQVLLTGVCFYISEGHSLGIQEFLEEFLGSWSFVDEQYYVLASTEKFADNAKRSAEHFVLGVDKYLEVVEVYVLKLLGTVLNDVKLATSWVETAELPEDRRQVLLRRLHSLHSVKATNSPQGSLSSSLEDNYDVEQIAVPAGYPKSRYGGTVKKQTVFNLSKKLEPCVWWFRTITLKFGSARVVISNGKIVSGFLILLIYYVLRRKQATIKRTIQRQALTMKNALVDLWQLAFSYQVNPLAAVQPLAAATQGGR